MVLDVVQFDILSEFPPDLLNGFMILIQKSSVFSRLVFSSSS